MWNKFVEVILPAIAIGLPRMFFRGITLFLGWMWFVAPVFGLPIIPLWECMPIAGLITILTFEHIGTIHTLESAWRHLGDWIIAGSFIFVMLIIFHLLGI